MNKIDKFVRRMDSLGIKIELAGNYPWVYIVKINNKRVKETFRAEHGFTLCFLPIRQGDEINFTDISQIFKLIRNYK